MTHAVPWGALLFFVFIVGAFWSAAVGPSWQVAVVALPIGALAVWRWVAGRSLRDLLRRNGTPFRLLAIAAGAAALTQASVIGCAIVFGLLEPVEADPRTIALAALIIAPLVGALLTALPEELVFRGFYLRTLRATIGGRGAVAASATLFSLAHLPNLLLTAEPTSGHVLVIRLLQLAGVGVLMGWAALRTGTVWFPVLWHAGANQPHVVASVMTAQSNELAWHLWASAALVVEASVLCMVLRLDRRLRGRRPPLQGA